MAASWRSDSPNRDRPLYDVICSVACAIYIHVARSGLAGAGIVEIATTMPPKRKTLTFQQKYDVVKYAEEHPGQKQVTIAVKFGLKSSTLSDILKNKDTIKSNVEDPEKAARKAGDAKRIRKVSYDDVDYALILWFRQNAGLPKIRINSEMLRQKAEYFAKEFGHEDPKITTGWVDRFKKRWGIAKIRKCGESGGVDITVVEDWKREKIADILRRFKTEDIFNADETGLFWQMLPENTLGFIGKSVHGKNQPEPRITVLVGANMDGSEKLPLFVIGTSKQPRAFKGVRHLPNEYTANRKAWMTSLLFEDWLKKLDVRMGRYHRKICMIVDNCTAHPNVGLDNIELVFLPPNTTSHTLPMDGGIIRNLKFFYRHILANRRLQAAEKKETFKWDLLDAMFAIKSAWANVKQSTIRNVFRKVGFVAGEDVEGSADVEVMEVIPSTSQEELNPTQHVEVTQFRNIWSRLAEILGEAIPNSHEEYVDVDAADMEVHPVLDDQAIIECVKNSAEQSDESDDDVVEVGAVGGIQQPSAPSISQAYDALDVIRRFTATLPDSRDTTEISRLMPIFDRVLLMETPRRLKQSAITDFMSD
uniref:tigger transposable element-derived protein 4-like n=1 Tax=Doryrhamphus excisus TaxID=161450 RepID=UPI0025ADE4DA|nr:tigger transposable element-derived protein 4-like [Doryrhamphus excisus]